MLSLRRTVSSPLTTILLFLFASFRCVAVAEEAAASASPAQGPATQWHMLNVSPREEQADCHLLVFPDGRKVLIDIADAGDAPGSALAALKLFNITELDLIVISHFHLDHYGRLSDLLESGVKVKRLAVNVPDEAAARREIPWGCNLDHVRATLEGARARGIEVFTPVKDECLIESTINGSSVAKLEVVCLRWSDWSDGPDW